MSFDSYAARFQSHPQCPIAVWDFWLEELMLGNKYVVGLIGFAADRMTRWLAGRVNLLCFLSEEEGQRAFVQQLQPLPKNLSIMAGGLIDTGLESDSLDFAVLGQAWLRVAERENMRRELGRVLRLNSYVSLVLHRVQTTGNAFADAYAQLLAQFACVDDYAKLPEEGELAAFFANHYAVNVFANQLRFRLETWLQYIESSDFFAQVAESKRPLLLRAARLLFLQQTGGDAGGELILDCNTQVYTGLFNRYVPAISLRKSVFFGLLRPFAFAFYVLVKLNVYFWRALYRLRYRIFPPRN